MREPFSCQCCYRASRVKTAPLITGLCLSCCCRLAWPASRDHVTRRVRHVTRPARHVTAAHVIVASQPRHGRLSASQGVIAGRHYHTGVHQTSRSGPTSQGAAPPTDENESCTGSGRGAPLPCHRPRRPPHRLREGQRVIAEVTADMRLHVRAYSEQEKGCCRSW